MHLRQVHRGPALLAIGATVAAGVPGRVQRPPPRATRQNTRPTGSSRVAGGPSGTLHRPARHPQDQARDHHHAGEPVVRQLLRHLSRRRRHPDEQRGADRLRAEPEPEAASRPYHDKADVNGGGPHGEANAIADVDGGKMDGFITTARHGQGDLQNPDDPPARIGPTPDVMGYHTAAEIPNYWTYAKDFVLDDHMFEPVKSWSLPDHLYMVSAWSAKCADPLADELRTTTSSGPTGSTQFDQAVHKELATGQTDDRPGLDRHHLAALRARTSAGPTTSRPGTQPDCDNDSAETCAPVPQSAKTPGIWNPLPLFGDVQARPPAEQHPVARRLLHAPPERARCPR